MRGAGGQVYTHIQPNSCLAMRVGQIIKKDAGGAVHYMLFNGSNTELAPVMAGPSSMQHFLCHAVTWLFVNVLGVPEEVCKRTDLATG